MIYFLSALLLNPNPVILGFEPPSAEGWQQSVVFRCGRTTLSVTGYGASKPFDGIAEIRVNGALLEGSSADALRLDLSHRRSVYRLGARCPRESNSISLFIDRGEKPEVGEVTYWSAAAFVIGNQLKSYTGLQEATADAFWFR